MLERKFQTLTAGLSNLHTHLEQLRFTITEDKPSDELAFTDRLCDICDDALGWLEDAQTKALEAQRTASHPADLSATVYSFGGTHQLLLRLNSHLYSELLSFERSEQLLNLAREREKPWQLWGLALRRGLERLQGLLFDLDGYVLECWQEIAERTIHQGVSVSATNIGQQITPQALKGVV